MDTSTTFLDSLRDSNNDSAWEQLVDLYRPLIGSWLRRLGASPHDHDDLAQEVMMVVIRRVSEFKRQPHGGAFRGWLRAITVNCLRDHWKRTRKQAVAKGGTDFGAVLDQLEDPHSGLSREWNEEHDQYVIKQLLQRIRGDFSDNTWKAFQAFAIEGKPADEVAERLRMTPNAVFIAKSRVMARLRTFGDGLVEL